MSEFPAVLQLGSLDGATGFRLDGAAAGNQSGRSVALAGDINGDGFDDLIIGAAYAAPNGLANAGSSYVVYGKAGGFAAAIDLDALDGSDGFRINGAAANDRSGRIVAAAGDINHDGLDDLFIGSPQSHQAHVLFGSTAAQPASVSLSEIDGSNGFRMFGAIGTGFSAGSAGDVNGDGIDDLIVGARGSTTQGGGAYLVYGKAAAFDAALDLTQPDDGIYRIPIAVGASDGPWVGSVGGAGDFNADGFDDVLIGMEAFNSEEPFDYGTLTHLRFGREDGGTAPITFFLGPEHLDTEATLRHVVSSVGDINGDGFDDFVVGAPVDDPSGDNYTRSGISYVVFGSSSTVGFPLTNLDGANGFRLVGAAAGDNSGYSVASAGDINGDGFDDLVIGAPRADPNGSQSGRAHVVFGKASGFAASIDLSSLDGSTGFTLDGAAGNDLAGWSVQGAGDVDGDGFDDVIVGAWGADPHGDQSGSSYVVFGRAPDAPVERIGTAIGNTIQGRAFADQLKGLGGDDVLEGRAGGDKLKGGNGIDTASYAHAATGLVANLANPGLGTGDAAGDRYNAIENLRGSQFDDQLAGDKAANVLEGLAGVDVLTGRKGEDVLIGGAGGDLLDGGDDNDTASYETAGAMVRVDLTDPTGASNLGDALGDTFVSIEQFVLSRFDDVFIGDSTGNIVFGLAGADNLEGQGGDDTLIGGAQGDTLDGGTGSDFASYSTAETGLTASLTDPNQNTGDAQGDSYTSIENLKGTHRADSLIGDAVDNILNGLSGNDTLVGLAGADRLFGEEGKDTFRFESIADSGITGATRDRIQDFEQGLDLVDLKLIDADSGVSGNQAFTFVGMAAFTGGAGELRYFHHNGNTIVEGDTTGAGTADFQVELRGLFTLAADDFKL